MQNSKPRNIQEYISQLPEKSAGILERISNTIKKIAPNAEETISYGMPTFNLHGKPLVYFGAFEKHIGFYALPSGNDAFQKELMNYKTGKGSIQFPLNEEMP